MLEEKILNDYREAMKNKDTLKSSTLSFLRAAMMNAAIEKRKKTLDDNGCLAVIRKQINERQDSIEQFNKGNRQDLVEKETRELEILKSYLPEELKPDEVKNIIEQVIAETGAKDLKEMGRVMKEVMAKVSGRADGKLVNDLVKEKLSKESPQK